MVDISSIWIHIIELKKLKIKSDPNFGESSKEPTSPTKPCNIWAYKVIFNKKGSWFNLSCLNKLDEISLDTLTVSRVSPNKSVFRFFLVCIDFGFKGTVHGLI